MIQPGDRVRIKLGDKGGSVILHNKTGTVRGHYDVGTIYDWWVKIDEFVESGPYAFYTEELEKI